MPASATEDELLHWLATALRCGAVTDAALRRWLALLLAQLQRGAGISLGALVRARHPLAQAAMRRLDALETAARQRGFEQLMLLAPADDAPAWETGLSPDWTFRFEPGRYPARHAYTGRYRFSKHYFELLHDLKSQGEEFECAKELDKLDAVKHWVRNIERQERFSFWLPTATDYFYPDFVAELKDGRLLVVEYKGEAYASNDDSRERRAVGAAWARASGGRGVFRMVEKTLDGRDVRAQLLEAVGG